MVLKAVVHMNLLNYQVLFSLQAATKFEILVCCRVSGDTLNVNSLPTGNFFMHFCRLLIFPILINFFEKFFQEYHQSVKQFGSRSSQHFDMPDLGPNLFAKVISRLHL